MNNPNQKGMKQSHYEKNQTFSENRLEKLLEIYNTTYYSRIKCTPEEIFNNPEIEKEYIFSQLEKREKQENIVKNHHLKEGMFVRYILPRANCRRKRFQISRECYKISSIKGNMYSLIARDGTTKNFPRFKLIMCSKDGSKPPNIIWNRIVSRIMSYNSKTKKYRVVFKVPGKED